MAKILIVDDEPNMLRGLRDNLEFDNHTVSTAINGKEGLEKLMADAYDLILLDVMMPEMSGLEVCKAARKSGINTPIIFLTAKGEEIDKILGLEFGADDYITKPFSVRELLARVKAILRRVKPEQIAVISQQTIGRLTVNFEQFEATCDGIPEKLSHKEFEILNFFIAHKGEVVSRYQLLENVWGYAAQPTTRTVDNFILRLRQKIEENPNDPKFILTVHGVGYRLIGL